MHAPTQTPGVSCDSSSVDKETLPHLDQHLVVDNYATHKTAAVKRWLKAHSRFHLHFTATSSSWLNMVERVDLAQARASVAGSGVETIPNGRLETPP